MIPGQNMRTLINSKVEERDVERSSMHIQLQNIAEDDQTMLWDLEHCVTDHVPGRLLLYIGMPVMIRYNIATELCITKGQEGTIVGCIRKIQV